MSNTSTTLKDKELKIKVTHKGRVFKTWNELKKHYTEKFNKK